MNAFRILSTHVLNKISSLALVTVVPSLINITQNNNNQIFQEITLLVIKAKEISNFFLLVGGPLKFRWNLNANAVSQLLSTKI